MSDTLINVWERITVYCLNHDEPLKMDIVKNSELIKTPFYACEHYKKSDNPEKAPCSNRLNLDDYQGLVLKLLSVISEEGITSDYTNYRFEYRGPRQKIFVRVLKYSDK